VTAGEKVLDSIAIPAIAILGSSFSLFPEQADKNVSIQTININKYFFILMYWFKIQYFEQLELE
jgi:hypothetical protein